MEVILWSTMLGFAVLVTAIVVSLYYRHKYGPIFCQLSELLGDKDLGETNKLAYKLADKTNKPAEKPTERTDKTIDNPTNIAKNETVQEDKFMRRITKYSLKRWLKPSLTSSYIRCRSSDAQK